MSMLNDAVLRYLVSQGIDTGHPATRLAPHTLQHTFRARGNCCCMWITITADEALRRVDIRVTGSPVAHKCRADEVNRFVAMANDGDSFGRFAIEPGTGAVYYATSAMLEGHVLDSDAVGFAVRVAGTRYDRLYPHLIEVINGAEPDRLWQVTEQPDWERINAEFNAMASRPPWGPSADEGATPTRVLRLPT